MITHFTIRNVQSPNPTAFTIVTVYWDTTDENTWTEMMLRFQNFMYDNPLSVRYGGNVLGSSGVIGTTQGVYRKFSPLTEKCFMFPCNVLYCTRFDIS